MLTQDLPWSPQPGRMRATLILKGHSLRPSCACTSGAKRKVGHLAGQTTHPHGLKMHRIQAAPVPTSQARGLSIDRPSREVEAEW